MAEYRMHVDLLHLPTELQELRMLAAESLGWQPLAPGVYLHLAQPSADIGRLQAQDVEVVDVVGVPDAGMAGLNVLLLG